MTVEDVNSGDEVQQPEQRESEQQGATAREGQLAEAEGATAREGQLAEPGGATAREGQLAEAEGALAREAEIAGNATEECPSAALADMQIVRTEPAVASPVLAPNASQVLAPDASIGSGLAIDGTASASSGKGAPAMAGANPKEELESEPSAKKAHFTMVPYANVTMVPEPLGLICKNCCSAVDPTAKGTKVTSKSPVRYQCGSCNVKCTTLSRLFGRWPIDAFRELPAEEQSNFFKTCGEGAENMKKAITKDILLKRARSSINKFGGTYKAPWQWEHEGMPKETVAKMVANCPSEEHDVLGKTYRVDLHCVSEKAIEEIASTHLAQLLEEGRAKAKRKAPELASASSQAAAVGGQSATEAPLPESTGEAQGPSSSSSSSTSSSSDKKKKKKKSKKDKKDKKDKKRSPKEKKNEDKDKDAAQKQKLAQESLKKAEAEQAKAKKELRKQWRATQLEAGRILGKVSAETGALESTVAAPGFNEVPPTLKATASKTLKLLQKYRDDARVAVNSAQPMPLTFTVQDSFNAVKTAMSLNKEIGTLLATVASWK